MCCVANGNDNYAKILNSFQCKKFLFFSYFSLFIVVNVVVVVIGVLFVVGCAKNDQM